VAPTALADGREPERLLPIAEGAPRHVELEVERSQPEVRIGDAADQRRHDGAPSPLGGEQLRSSGLAGAPVLAPEIELPPCGALGRAPHRRSGSEEPDNAGDFWPRTLAPDGGGRKLVRAGDTQLCLRFEDPRGGDAEIVVALQRRADECLKLSS
jgi:hypothetical protein